MTPRTTSASKRSRVVRAEVIGGPAGKAMRVPNSKTKRGWSMVKVKWRFDGFKDMPDGWCLPETVVCGGQFYSRRQEDGKWYYVHDGPVPLPPAVDRAIGGSAFWCRLLPALQAEPADAGGLQGGD
jgi:hypothetical protein